MFKCSYKQLQKKIKRITNLSHYLIIFIVLQKLYIAKLDKETTFILYILFYKI